MKNHVFALTAGFFATFIANAVLSILVIGPFLAPHIGIVRTKEAGLQIPAMIIGYMGLAVFMLWLIHRLPGKNWFQRGSLAGSITGLVVFVAGHAIVAGWSVAGATGMLLAGVVDACAATVGGIAMAFILRNSFRETSPDHGK